MINIVDMVTFKSLINSKTLYYLITRRILPLEVGVVVIDAIKVKV